jgi:two-component system cell cycle response regulator CpdR
VRINVCCSSQAAESRPSRKWRDGPGTDIVQRKKCRAGTSVCLASCRLLVLTGSYAVVSRVVLVVDDEAMVLDVTASMLEDLGCEVVTARGGNDALRKLSTDSRIEVLITDINMPGMDGYELAEKARRMREGLKVIVLSGHAHNGRGFPFIRKPFLESDLKRTMAQHTGLC